MAFIHKNLQNKYRSKITFLKGATFFFLGMSCVLFLTQAFEVIPSMPNSVIFIKSIFLTSNGSNTTTTGIILEGEGGHGWFKSSVTVEELSGVSVIGTDAKGKLVSSSSESVYNFISGYVDQQEVPSYRSLSGENIYKTNTGYVGIGTDTPTQMLQILGNAIIGDIANTLSGIYSAIFGGKSNSLSGDYTVIAGGESNTVSGSTHSAIVGGISNSIDTSDRGFIGGGSTNRITNSSFSTVLGGRDNVIESASYSVVGGFQSQALHTNSFVRNSDQAAFATTRAKSFIINAPYSSDKGVVLGGVGINTNDPQVALDVEGIIRTRPVSSAAACTSALEGSIYYDTEDKRFYGCSEGLWKAIAFE